MRAAAAVRPALSVVVPVYNESANIGPLSERLGQVLNATGRTYEVIYVDDGSRDDTAERVRELGREDQTIRLVRLSRNFGHQAALFAGLEAARGEAVITLDGDLQHPPELIPQLIEKWREGSDVVQTIRRETAGETALKRATSRWFYGVLSRLTKLEVTPGAADFRLLSRVAVDAFVSCRERRRFNRGLVQWIGFAYTEVAYDAEARHAGKSKYSYRAMLRLAGDAIFSFSTWPLRVAGLAGACLAVPAAAYLVYVIWVYFFTDLTVPGWSSILACVLILGGANLVMLSIIGEYISRMYEEVKQRPIYIVRPSEPANGSAHAQQD